MEVMLYTQSEAARLLGISRQAVSDAMRRGRIIASLFSFNGPPMIAGDEVERYRIERRPNRNMGTPSKRKRPRNRGEYGDTHT